MLGILNHIDNTLLLPLLRFTRHEDVMVFMLILRILRFMNNLSTLVMVTLIVLLMDLFLEGIHDLLNTLLAFVAQAILSHGDIDGFVVLTFARGKDFLSFYV